MTEFKALKKFAAGRDDKGVLVVYAAGKSYKADSKKVLVWAKRGWVEAEKPKAPKK